MKKKAKKKDTERRRAKDRDNEKTDRVMIISQIIKYWDKDEVLNQLGKHNSLKHILNEFVYMHESSDSSFFKI